MYVCLLSIEIQTAGWIGWNLTQRWSSRGEGSWVFFTPPHPLGTGCIKGVQGASGASTMHFGENFIKQKLQGTPDLVGAGHLFGPQIWKDLGPMSFWSHGHSLWRIAYKIKVAWYVPNSYFMTLDTLYLASRVQGAQKGGPVGFWSLSCAFWWKLCQTKVAGHPQLVGAGHL